MPCTRLPSCCQSTVPRCQASEVQVWPSILVRTNDQKQHLNVDSVNLIVMFRDDVNRLIPSIVCSSFNCGENWHDPVKCKVRKWGIILLTFSPSLSLSTSITFSIHCQHDYFIPLFYSFYSGWENGSRNAMMTVKPLTGLLQIPRYRI